MLVRSDIAQRVDGIQSAGLARGSPAEEHAHGGGEARAQRDGAPGDRKGRAQRPAENQAQQKAHAHARQSADHAQQEGFDQELNLNLPGQRAQRLLQAGFPCPVVEADAEMLPFADNTFDVVTVSFGIRNMTHKDRALREMLRVLRPGGRLLVLEFSKCQPWFKPIYDFYSFRFMPWAGGVIAGDRESYRYLAESIRMHPDQPTFAGMMTDAGFERVSWKNMTFGICAMHIGFKPGA